MCGGIREFESLRSPSPQVISLLHEELRQFGLQGSYGDQYHQDDTDTPVCSPGAHELSLLCRKKPFISPPSNTHSEVAAGQLAISSKLPQSPPPICPQITINPINNPRSSSTPNQKSTRVQQIQSSAPSSITNQHKPRVFLPSQSSASRTSTTSKKSIFCSAFSPPNDNVYITMPEPPSTDFMDACFSCKRPLGCGKDVYMYRGERAFCSNECRYQHIAEDELLQRQQILAASSASALTDEANHCNHRIAAQSPFIPVLG